MLSCYQNLIPVRSESLCFGSCCSVRDAWFQWSETDHGHIPAHGKCFNFSPSVGCAKMREEKAVRPSGLIRKWTCPGLNVAGGSFHDTMRPLLWAFLSRWTRPWATNGHSRKSRTVWPDTSKGHHRSSWTEGNVVSDRGSFTQQNKISLKPDGEWALSDVTNGSGTSV